MTAIVANLMTGVGAVYAFTNWNAGVVILLIAISLQLAAVRESLP
jgi:hypothetical protein